MSRILLVGATTGYQTRIFTSAASRLGHDLVYATDRCRHLDDPWRDHAIPVRFHEPFASAEAVAKALGSSRPVDAIIAVGDRPAYLAAVIAERLGLPFSPAAAVERAGNKFLARRCFEAAGLPVPWYFRVPVADGLDEALRQVRYPCVLKPLGLSASRGVIRANHESEFRAAFHRIAAILETRDIRRLKQEQNRYIQVERFIPGREFALEGLVADGRLRTLALFDKPDPLDGPFFEETIYTTPSRQPASVQTAIFDATARAIAALGLTRGPVHAEMRLNGDDVWMLEVAARPIGGLCSQALHLATPEGSAVTLEELIMRHALNQPVEHIASSPGSSGVLMVPVPRAGVYQGVEGVEEAAAVPGVERVIITAKDGQRVQPPPEGSTYLGFVFAAAARPQAVEQALRSAHALLRFSIMGEVALV
jgi:biotin carboxylase